MRRATMTKVLSSLALTVGLVLATTACEHDDTDAGLLSTQVFFDTAESELTPDARSELASFANRVQAAGGGGTIVIAGHTDDEGSSSYNQTLSERRADAVETELADLLSDLDVSFETTGYGDREPAVPNDSTENRAQNRRVEVAYRL
jgi:outer membrane protein OmpA-like peptidoglycan-associated protein